MRENSKKDQPQSIGVSVITEFYPPDYAATGQLIEELVTCLGQQDIQIKVFTGQPSYAFDHGSAAAFEKKGNVTVHRSRVSRFWSKRIRGKALNGLLFCVRSALHLLNPSNHGDVLLLTTAPPYLPVLGYLANLIFGVSYVCVLYDIYPDIAVELGVISPHHWMTRFWQMINRQVWMRSQRLIVLSSTMKDRIVGHCPEVADKVAVIHSWANPHQIVPLPKRCNWFAHQHNLVRPFTVLYSGNMGRCHDMDTILLAMEQLRNDPIQFIFIGGGPKRQALIDRVEELGLKNCQFLPYQDKRSLPYSLTACDLSLVSVSPRMEGLVAPSKFYSSLAAARPVAVICEEASYLRRVLLEANCGESFRNGDGDGLADFIRRLAGNLELVEAMGDSGRRYLLAHFTPDIIAQQYAQVLRGSTQNWPLPAQPLSRPPHARPKKIKSYDGVRLR